MKNSSVTGVLKGRVVKQFKKKEEPGSLCGMRLHPDLMNQACIVSLSVKNLQRENTFILLKKPNQTRKKPKPDNKNYQKTIKKSPEQKTRKINPNQIKPCFQTGSWKRKANCWGKEREPSSLLGIVLPATTFS